MPGSPTRDYHDRKPPDPHNYRLSGRCVGTFGFRALLTAKATSPPLTDLVVVVTTLTNGNFVQNAEGGPVGWGPASPCAGRQGLPTGVLQAGEAFEVPFIICLTWINPFTFLVDVRGAIQ